MQEKEILLTNKSEHAKLQKLPETSSGNHGMGVLDFLVGCVADTFKTVPLAWPIFVKMISLARLISTSKVPRVGVF